VKVEELLMNKQYELVYVADEDDFDYTKATYERDGWNGFEPKYHNRLL
jgi:hypothetical protein